MDYASPPPPPTIVATTLVGNNAPLIADAIRSVRNFVDVYLVIDTGCTDSSIEIARRVAKKKMIVVQYQWCNDFAAARNFSLETAAGLGYDWALTLDTDERISIRGDVSSLRSRLIEQPHVKVWLAANRVAGYTKERMVRLPTQAVWTGRTHEFLAGCRPTERSILGGLEFYEPPKCADDLENKLTRDLRILREETNRLPDAPRWWFYLGQTLEKLGEYDEAAAAFLRNSELSRSSEEVAWSRYSIARCHLATEEFSKAIVVCSAALQDYLHSPELACIAAECALGIEDWSDAERWARLAIDVAQSKVAAQRRKHFRFMPAWFEKPYQSLSIALKQSGNVAEAKECQMLRVAEFEKRIRLGAG